MSAAATDQCRSPVLGPALTYVARLAQRYSRCSAGFRGAMAPPGGSISLALEKPPSRAPQNRSRDPATRSTHVPGQPVVGCATHSRGTALTWVRGVRGDGLEEVTTAPRSPWQNPNAERVIGSIRRECLDYMIVLGRRCLKALLSNCVDYYHSARTHLSLDKDTPNRRPTQSQEHCNVIELRRVYGLHHEYVRMTA